MAGSAQPLGVESGARRYQLFINGKFVDSRSGKRFESISPHDRSVVAVVAEGDKADIEAAVGAARAAYEGTWSSTPADQGTGDGTVPVHHCGSKSPRVRTWGTARESPRLLPPPLLVTRCANQLWGFLASMSCSISWHPPACTTLS